MVFTIISVFHYIVCIILIAVILLQAGRGQGLSGFGGESTQSIFGTKTSSFMNKATTFAAIGFLVSCMALDMTKSIESKSLVFNEKMKELAAMAQANKELPKGVTVQKGDPNAANLNVNKAELDEKVKKAIEAKMAETQATQAKAQDAQKAVTDAQQTVSNAASQE